MSTSPPRPLVAFVDVDDTLVRSFGSKRIVMSSTVDTARRGRRVVLLEFWRG